MLHLFSPLTFRHTRLRNRIVLTALPCGYAAPDGFASGELAQYYLERARGGVGMLVVEHTCVIPPSAPVPHLGLYDDAQVPDLRQLVGAARRAGPPVLVMLDQSIDLNPMGESELREIGEAFVRAAWRARAVGADGVMFSCADGGPFEQLVSPLRNHRSDRYGGAAGRLRLLLTVVETVGAWMGSRFVVGVRLNVEEFAPGGLTLQDTRVIAKRLIGAGAQLLEADAASVGSAPVARFPGWRVPLAAGLKAVVDVPVIVGALSDDARLVDQVVREGGADLVALSETLRDNPLWPQQARAALIGLGPAR